MGLLSKIPGMAFVASCLGSIAEKIEDAASSRKAAANARKRKSRTIKRKLQEEEKGKQLMKEIALQEQLLNLEKEKLLNQERSNRLHQLDIERMNLIELEQDAKTIGKNLPECATEAECIKKVATEGVTVLTESIAPDSANDPVQMKNALAAWVKVKRIDEGSPLYKQLQLFEDNNVSQAFCDGFKQGQQCVELSLQGSKKASFVAQHPRFEDLEGMSRATFELCNQARTLGLLTVTGVCAVELNNLAPKTHSFAEGLTSIQDKFKNGRGLPQNECDFHELLKEQMQTAAKDRKTHNPVFHRSVQKNDPQLRVDLKKRMEQQNLAQSRIKDALKNFDQERENVYKSIASSTGEERRLQTVNKRQRDDPPDIRDAKECSEFNHRVALHMTESGLGEILARHMAEDSSLESLYQCKKQEQHADTVPPQYDVEDLMGEGISDFAAQILYTLSTPIPFLMPVLDFAKLEIVVNSAELMQMNLGHDLGENFEHAQSAPMNLGIGQLQHLPGVSLCVPPGMVVLFKGHLLHGGGASDVVQGCWRLHSYSLPKNGINLKGCVRVPNNKTLYPDPVEVALSGITRDTSPYTDAALDALISNIDISSPPKKKKRV